MDATGGAHTTLSVLPGLTQSYFGRCGSKLSVLFYICIGNLGALSLMFAKADTNHLGIKNLRLI